MTDPREAGEAPEPAPPPPGEGGLAAGERDQAQHQSRLGPAPAVEGAAGIRDALRARMFGDLDEPETSTLGPAPAVEGAENIRAALEDRLFGAGERKAPAGADPKLGPAPAVEGADRIRSALKARLFGDDDESDDALPVVRTAGDEDEDEDEDGPELAGRIGRFRVLDRLGRGGMGVVYSAYDPELDRKVAIKLLRPDVRRGLAKGDAQARLQREAQAMARLSDPNVIVVHEVGTVDDHVFVAMEFIDGMTLGQWLAQERRDWTEVLEVFLKAGSGLAAAHRGELVHRDFKPDNVLLGHDGRVRVVDFGLARSVGDDAQPSLRRQSSEREQPELDTLNTPLTRTGAVMGTPAYMSPEQYMGSPAEARSDQFSFCVALYEGLFGLRPFAGESLTELANNVIEGNIRETPGEARVPKRLLAALRRGLAVKPADRYPSMEALLVELRRDPFRAWRWGGVVAGAGLVASLATFAITSGTDASDACTGLDQRLVGVWDDEVRAAVTEALEATGRPYAGRVAQTTVALLDDYTQAWVGMAEDACGVALVAQDDGEEPRRRQLCLDQRLAEVGALVEALREPQEGMVTAAVRATSVLTAGLSVCADPRRLAGLGDEIDDPQIRQRLATAHAELAKAKAKAALGHYDEAVALSTGVIEQARAAGAESLLALGLVTRGTARERAAQGEEGAEADLRAAIELADRKGDHETRAQALIMLVYVLGQDRTRYDEAKRIGVQARSVLEYINADPLPYSDLDNNLGVAARKAGQTEEAIDYHLRSHSLLLKVHGEDHPAVGRSLLNIGIALEDAEKAEPYLRQALQTLVRTLGSHHPMVGSGLTNLGNCLGRQERYAAALPLQRRALEIFEQAYGPEHARTLRTAFNLARLMLKTGRYEEAATLLRRGLRLRERELGADDVRLVGWVSHLARTELELGHLEQARPLLERSLALRRKSNETAVAMGADQFRLARALLPVEPERARQLAIRARAAYLDEIGRQGGRTSTHSIVVKRLERTEAWLHQNGGLPESAAAPSPGDTGSGQG